MILLLPLVAGAAVLLLLVGLRQFRSDPLQGLSVEDFALLRPQVRRRDESPGPITALARRVAPGLGRLLGAPLLERLRRLVDEAGRPDGLTLDRLLTQISWWLVLVSPLVVVELLQGQVFLAVALPVAVGYLPILRLATAQRRRRERIDRDLPDFLDVLAVTVVAGVGFRIALERVAERFSGPLSEEVALTLQQIANGASVRDAFTDLRRRSSSESVAQFVSALLQSQELGAPLAESLGQIADDMRRASSQRQRQAAARTSPRVSLVASLVLVPGVLVLIIVGLFVGTHVDFSAILG